MGHRCCRRWQPPPGPPKSDPWMGVAITLGALFLLGSLQSIGIFGWLVLLGIGAACVWALGKGA